MSILPDGVGVAGVDSIRVASGQSDVDTMR
jgi:hypothetical protein